MFVQEIPCCNHRQGNTSYVDKFDELPSWVTLDLCLNMVRVPFHSTVRQVEHLYPEALLGEDRIDWVKNLQSIHLANGAQEV